MANIIPMVSSSPPPLDDTGGFDDWNDDDDDFGGFKGADDDTNTWATKNNQSLDKVNANSDGINTSLPTDTRLDNCKDKVSSLSLGLSEQLNKDIDSVSGSNINEPSCKTFDTVSGNSTGDSGLFDVSPTPISEDTQSETSPTHTSEDTNTDNSEHSLETFSNTPDDIPESAIVDNNSTGEDIDNDSNEDTSFSEFTDNNVRTEECCSETVSCNLNNSISQTEQLSSQNCDDLSTSPTDDQIVQNTKYSNVMPSNSDSSDIPKNDLSNSHTLDHSDNDDLTEVNISEQLDTDSANLTQNDSLSGRNGDATLETDSIHGKESELSIEKLSDHEDDSSKNESTINIDKNDQLSCSDSISAKTNECVEDSIQAETCVKEEEDDDLNLKNHTEMISSSQNIENDFADFSSAVLSESVESSETPVNDNSVNVTSENIADDDDDDDDFADFSSAPITSSFEQPVSVDAELKNDDLSKDSVSDNFTKFSASNEETDDFGDFSSQGNVDNTEVVDKFANFSTSPAEDDDFGEFGSVSANTGEEGFGEFGAVSTNSGEGGFADFSSAPPPDNSFTGKAEENHDDSWAAFEEEEVEFSNTSDMTESTIQQKQDKVSSLIDDCFNETIELSQDAQDMEVRLKEEESVLWLKIQELEHSGVLKWSQSTSYRNLFVSLKIDTKNILLGHKKPAVPIYAAQLTLLEPTKGVPNLLQPEDATLVDTTKQDDVKDLPPVQFDWTSSGLTNPLEENNKLQNLDFLTVDEAELMAKTKAFDADLIHGQKPAMQPLQNILANLKATKKTRLEDLSNEAGKVISHLPNLSFMKSKVLMFPLKNNDL